MNVIYFGADHGASDESWVTDSEAAILSHLRQAQLHFDAMPEDYSGELATFDDCLAEAETIIVARIARRSAKVPPRANPGDFERQLRAIDAGQKRARRERLLTVYAIIGVSVVAALAATFRFMGAA